MRWTKGFDIGDGIGSDPAASLTRALRHAGWAGGVAALLNDGIAIFGAARYRHPRTAVSMILGTGVLPPACVLSLGRTFYDLRPALWL